uniref:Uncharacterized protein n=1 Tax=viral metagenome TaxID=1070528 RepID=A0A6M3K4G3_9ZZZZ
MLNEEQVFCLRRIVHTTSKDDKATEDIEFSKRELKDIEEAIPLYGTADPTKYPPLQIKISNALLSMETIFIEDIEPITEVNYGNDSSDNTDQDSYCIPNSETRTGTIEEIRPRYDLPQPERTGG